MSATTCSSLIDHYVSALSRQFRAVEDGDGCSLHTPFYLPDNTRLAIHLFGDPQGRVQATDLGETIDWLFLSGVDVGVDDPRIQQIGRRFGLDVDGGELSKTVAANGNDSPDARIETAISDVIHGVLDLAYLVYTRQPRRTSTFASTVDDLMATSGRSYKRRFEVDGKTGERTFDFYVPRVREPLLIETISTTSRQSAQEQAERAAFKAIDTKDVGGKGALYLAILDDSTEENRAAFTERAVKSLSGYVNDVVYWSDRARIDTYLAVA